MPRHTPWTVIVVMMVMLCLMVSESEATSSDDLADVISDDDIPIQRVARRQRRLLASSTTGSESDNDDASEDPNSSHSRGGGQRQRRPCRTVAAVEDQHVSTHGGRARGRGRGRGRGRVASTGRGRGRGRGRAVNASNDNVEPSNALPSVVEPLFSPNQGDASTRTNWSLTIGCNGRDVPDWWLARTHDYLAHYDLRGAASIEKGGRNQIKHIQCVVEVTCGSDSRSIAAFKHHYKNHMPINPSDASKLTFKPLADGQTFVHMLGYVQKDLGMPHYKIVKHDVTEFELEEARKAYADVSADYKSGKVLITKNSLTDRLFSFWHSHYRPFHVPLDVVLLHMIRNGKYAPAGTWLTSAYGKALDIEAANTFFHMITRPTACTLEHIRILFFAGHLPRANSSFRYFNTITVPDFKAGLSDMQKACADLWYRHCYDINTMAQVTHELRKCLCLVGVDFDDHNTVDAVFVGNFTNVLKKVAPMRVQHSSSSMSIDALDVSCVDGPDPTPYSSGFAVQDGTTYTDMLEYIDGSPSPRVQSSMGGSY